MAADTPKTRKAQTAKSAGTIAKGKATTSTKRKAAKRAAPAIEELQTPGLDPLNPKHLRMLAFVDQYLIDKNGTQAAIRAGYSTRSANQQASRLLANVNIQRILAEKAQQAAMTAGLEQVHILEHLVAIATADANELVQYRRDACRYCHGAGHRYQFTPAEYDAHRAKWEKAKAEAEDADEEPPVFDPKGGIGFNANREPNPNCPECHGRGHGSVLIMDSRYVSESARILYAGARTTKEGEEVRMHDKCKALEMLAKHKKLYEDGVKVDVTVVDPVALEAMYTEAMEESRRQRAEMQHRDFSHVTMDNQGEVPA